MKKIECNVQFCHGGGLAILGTLSILCFSFSVDMTTPAGGFLVINYHDAGRKVSKSNLDRGRKQKRPLCQIAVDPWHG